MTAYPKLDAAMAVGDRVVLWIGLLGLIALLAWQIRETETNSPTLISPTCVTTGAK